MPSNSVPFAISTDLPPYRVILAVDAKNFTAEPGSTHQVLSGRIPQLVAEALRAVGLGDEWDHPAFYGPTGDGFAVGMPTRVLPYLVHPFLDELQQVLARHNRAGRRGDALLRLRVSLNVGPLPAESERPELDGNGTARNDTHRLLDSVPVRSILTEGRPTVVFVAAILSDRVFQDVVVAGYAGRHPDHFVSVPAVVNGKEFSQPAWLYVPEWSGNLLHGHVMNPAEQPLPPDRQQLGDGPPSSRMKIGRNSGQAAGTVYGGMTMHRGDQDDR
jgi:hypothetical protein